MYDMNENNNNENNSYGVEDENESLNELDKKLEDDDPS